MKNTGALPRYLNDPSYYKNKDFLFLDISGFTPLCDKFIRESSYGAEKIGDLVNTVFNPIIDFVYETGGDVISFAGDALFISAEKKEIKSIERKCGEIIRSQSIDKNLSIRIEIFEGKYYPQIMNTNRSSLFCYSKNLRANEELKYVPFPKEIFEIYRSSFSGELRAVPVFFIHIGEEYGIADLKPLLEFLSDSAKEHSVYVNKIEYLDKGWMILLSAGSPVYAADAPVKMYGLLAKFIKKAKKLNIPVRTGGTLQRGYCGIIGNEKRWEFTFLGSNVNLAARIAVNAQPDKVYADSSFSEAVKTTLKTLSAGRKEYKGVGQREIFEITGKLEEIRNVFVGREDEIRSCLNFYAGDRRAFVLLNGPSGIGKTMLAENIIQSLGYKNLIRLKGIYGTDEPEYLFRDSLFFKGLNSGEIFKKFRSISEPTLIYIDDLHFADDKSLFTFHRMINEGCPFVNFIATTIGTDKIRITPLSYYESLVVDLKPFSAKDIREITKIVSGIDITLKVSREIEKTTHGNPLFISGILPYLNTETKDTGKIPYSLQEVILLKLNQIPGKGPEFVDGGSVYGDIFDSSVMKEVVSIKSGALKDILHKAETEGLVRRSQARDEMEFSNTIIREIIYEKMLRKKIDYFRVRIAESIFMSRTKDIKKLYKALTLMFLAEDERTLDFALKIAAKYRNTKNHDLLRKIFISSFEFMKQKNIYQNAYDFIDLITRIGIINVGAELSSVVEQAALHVSDWRNKEIKLIDIAKMVFFNQFKIPEELLEKYKALKGEDKYYFWVKARTMAYKRDPNETRKDLYSLKNKFSAVEKMRFYIDFVWFAFFITGDVEMENEGIEVLSGMEGKMPEDVKSNYLLLKNTIAMHRDDMCESKRLLDEVSKMKSLNADEVFNLLNDYAIIYSNLAYENNDPGYMKRSLKYSEKAVNLLKDYQKTSELPLASTNLAGFYMTNGLIKKGMRAYLEGLYYGINIDHPVEVPYTKSRIAFIALSYGAYRVSLMIAEEVINSDVGDIKSAAYTIRHLYGKGRKNDMDKAYEYSEKYEKFGTGKCWWEMLGVMSSCAVNENDMNEMSKIRKKFIELRKIPQRQVMRFTNEANIQILGVLTGMSSEVKNLKSTSVKLDKLGINRGLLSKCIYALGMYNNDPEDLRKARRLAIITRSYPFILRIEKELLRLTGDKYWSVRIRKTQEKLEQMNRIGSIEDLLGSRR
ncbi:MAG: AAA family ATPase [Candidatus Delongbacteria bacterium]|nr:AAA family ATPase [Candidatus Delongbacteria bacterium]